MKVLFLEDNETDVKLIRHTLEKENIRFDSRTVETRDDFKDALIHFSPDVILADHNLPSFNSLEALEIVTSQHLDIPFILVTGTVSEEFAVECIKKGADDYILKNKMSRLPVAIEQAISKKRIEQEKDKIARELLLTNNELRTFIYSTTHNLRGPLTTIIGLTKLAKAKKKDEEDTSEYIKMIAEAAHALDDTLIELIEIMSIKDAQIAATKIDLSTIIEGTLKEIEKTQGFQRSNCSFVNSCIDGFFSDEKIFKAIIRNLVVFILRHQKNEAGQQLIIIEINSIPSGIRMEFRGDNFGFNEDLHDKVFEMFFKLSAETEETGLDLYLVKNGVEKLHGTVRLEQQKSKDSAFIIELPTLPHHSFGVEDL